MKFLFKKPRSLFGRIVLWGVPTLFVLCIGGVLYLHSWLGSYLQSEAFRQWLGRMTSKQLDARCEYEPFHFSGLTVNADAFKAQGTDKAAFSTLEVDKIHTGINMAGLWSKTLEVDDVDVDHFRISLGHTGAPPVPESEIGVEPVQPKEQSSSPSWLSPKFDLRKVVIRETDVLWGENTPQAGSVTGTEVTVKPDHDAWNVLLQGGTISQKGGPDLKLDHIKLNYQGSIVDISEGLLQFPPGGNIGLTGQVNTQKNLDVNVKVNGIPLKPFLPPDTQSKLQGTLFADIKVSGTMPMEAAPQVSGVGHLENADIGGFPTLDFLAKILHSPSLSRIKLNTASANFVYADEKVTVTNMVIESKGLVSITGRFVIKDSKIDGHFQVGIPHNLLGVLAVLESQVFTRNEGGYSWASVNVWGPLSAPQNDLLPRLEKAVPEAVLGAAEGIIKNVPNIKDVPKVPNDPKKAIDGLIKGFR